MKALKTILIAQAWMLVLAAIVSGQVVRIEPAKPLTGQSLVLTYDPKVAGARLTTGEEVYAIGQIYFPERKPVVLKMSKVGNVFRTEFKLPVGLSYINFSFRTVNLRDTASAAETMVYRPDGTPVRNAFLSKMLGDASRQTDYQSLFAKEIELYPDNIAAYLVKWDVAPRQLKRPELEAMLRKDMEIIESQARTQSVEYLYAKVFSLMVAGERDKPLPLLQQMVKTHPDSPLTWKMLAGYVAQAKVNNVSGDAPQAMERALWQIAERQPDSQLARETLQSLAWAADTLIPSSEFPLDAIELIASRWMDAEPDNPFPHYFLGKLYHDRQQKSGQALALAEKSLVLYEAEKHKLYMNSGKIYATENLLADSCMLSASLNLRLGKPAEAYLRVKDAQMWFQKSPFKTTEFKLQELEGRSLLAQGNLIAAEKAFLAAWMNGSDNAEAELQAIYQKREGETEGFTGYLRKKRDELAIGKMAAAFSITTLGGRKLDLAALKGKIVVLNFWFTTCSPCIAEMPALNKLVSEYKDKDIVFIAFAKDPESEVREFLKNRTFNYQQVSNADDIHEKYEINLWPTHVILNPEGKVVQRLTGGGLNRDQDLRRLISRLLY